jgi:hypothetical protein
MKGPQRLKPQVSGVFTARLKAGPFHGDPSSTYEGSSSLREMQRTKPDTTMDRVALNSAPVYRAFTLGYRRDLCASNCWL